MKITDAVEVKFKDDYYHANTRECAIYIRDNEILEAVANFCHDGVDNALGNGYEDQALYGLLIYRLIHEAMEDEKKEAEASENE